MAVRYIFYLQRCIICNKQKRVVETDKGLQRWFLLRITESRMLEPPAEEESKNRNAAEEAE